MPYKYSSKTKSSLLVCLLLFFIAFGFSQDRSSYNLLWKIEGKNLTKPSYIFGTMHVDDIRAFKFSDAVMPAIEETEMFALEVNPDSLVIAMTNKVIDRDPKDVFKDVLSDEEYQLLVDRFEEINTYSFEDSELRDPNTILALLMPETEKDDDQSTFVDLYLYNQARTMQKSITGLEDMYEQLNYFENLPPEYQRLYILDQLEDDVETLNNDLEKLTKIYYTGNIQAIDSMIQTYHGYDSELISRNQVMVNSIMKITQDNSLFSAVGAAHLPGENGIIALLQKEGYDVTPVEATFKGIADTYVVDESKMLWYIFKDEELGYSIEVPNKPNYSEDFPGFTIHMYQGLNDNNLYLFSGINVSFYDDDMDFSALIENFVNTLTESYEGELRSLTEVDISDGIKYIAKIDMPDNNLMQLHVLVKDKMLYYQGVQSEDDDIENNKSVIRFFNSLKTSKPKAIENKAWIHHHDNVGAFSIELPDEPKNVSREQPNPYETDSEPYILNMFMVTDYANDNNYIVRYNDHPTGYYMEDIQVGFDEIKKSFETKAIILNNEKTIYLNGYEGREYELLLQEKYHTICRVYYRGNRMYLLMLQKLNETEKADPESPFLTSFKFEDYESPSTLTALKPKDSNFEVQFFEKNRLIIDTVDYDDSHIKNSHDYYTKNPKSGGVYQFGYSDLQDYFKIKSYAEFYELNKNHLLGWNDSLVKQDTVKVANGTGLDFYILNKNNNLKTRYRIWLQDKQFFMVSAFVAEEELNNDVTNRIFNSFKVKKQNPKPFDVFSSKSEQIFKDLKSKDSIIYKRAFGALTYYDFEESDIESIHKALSTSYSDSLKNNQIKNSLVTILSNLNNESTLKVLQNEYEKSTTSDALKTSILVAIPDLPNTEAIAVYTDLLFKKPPKDSDSYNWGTLSPFKDSLAYANSHYSKLLSLLDHTKFRRDILNISTGILKDSTLNNQVVKDGFDSITKWTMTDLATYIKNSETEDYDYTYNSLMYAYTGLFHETQDDKQVIKDFTQEIISKDSNEWMISEAIEIRIKHNFHVEDTLINNYLKNKNHRLDIIRAFHDANKLHEIPDNYLNEASLSEIILYNYTSDDYDVDNINNLGIVTYENKDYYIFSFNHIVEEGETSEDYIGIVGPMSPISQDSPLNFPDAYSNWDSIEDDWQSQGLKLIPDLIEYGY